MLKLKPSMMRFMQDLIDYLDDPDNECNVHSGSISAMDEAFIPCSVTSLKAVKFSLSGLVCRFSVMYDRDMFSEMITLLSDKWKEKGYPFAFSNMLCYLPYSELLKFMKEVQVYIKANV